MGSKSAAATAIVGTKTKVMPMSMQKHTRKLARGAKFRKVMHEFGAGGLKSSSGQRVTSQKQAVAIAFSEQRRAKRA